MRDLLKVGVSWGHRLVEGAFRHLPHIIKDSKNNVGPSNVTGLPSGRGCRLEGDSEDEGPLFCKWPAHVVDQLWSDAAARATPGPPTRALTTLRMAAAPDRSHQPATGRFQYLLESGSNTEHVAEAFREAAGSGEPAPWDLILPDRPPAPNAGASGQRELDDANANRLRKHAIVQNYQNSLRSLLTRYKTYCRQQQRPVDSPTSIAGFLARGIAIGVANPHRPRVGLKTHKTVESNIKLFAALAVREKWRTRPGAELEVTELYHSMARMVGSVDANLRGDTFEAPTWVEVCTLSTALYNQGWRAEALFVLVAWLIASRVSDLLKVRLCDLLLSPGAIIIKMPHSKPDRRHQGQINNLPEVEEQDIHARVRVEINTRSVETAQGGRRRLGVRLFPFTREQLLTKVRTVDSTISTSRAYRRGFISAAMEADDGFLDRDIALVSHHERMDTLRLYSQGLPPRRDLNLQVAIAQSAMNVQ